MYGFRARLCESENSKTNETCYTDVVRISGDDYTVTKRKNNVELETGSKRGVSIASVRTPGVRMFHKDEFYQLFPKALPFCCRDEMEVMTHLIMSDEADVMVQAKEPKNIVLFLNNIWKSVVEEKKTLFICIG